MLAGLITILHLIERVDQRGEEAKKLASQQHVSTYTFQLRLRLETGSPRLAYLNSAIIVGSAQRQDAAVIYDAYIVQQHLPRSVKL